MPTLNAEDRLGTTLAGKYRIDRILGAGGMGTVFAGLHAWTGREVAVKMLNADFATDPAVVQRFLQEARAAAKLRHPNVVDVLDMGQAEDGAVYLVLELMQGKPLSDAVARGPMSVDDTLARLLPTIDALALAHSHGIVHRDLKPDNIFLSLDAQGREVPKLLDFGIAKVAGGNTAKTGTGFIVGTPSYMSPEQALGKADLGPPSDVWSMGVVLFQCLTARLPFESEVATALLVNIVTQRAPGVGTMGVALPPALVEVVDRALLTDPAARFAHAGELAQALRDAVGGVARAGAAVAPTVVDARPPHESAAPGPIVQPGQASATPFTWAGTVPSDDAGAPPKRALPKVALIGAGLVAAALIGVVVLVGRGPSDVPPSTLGHGSAGAASPTSPVEPPRFAAPVVVPVPAPVVAAQAPDAGQAQLAALPDSAPRPTGAPPRHVPHPQGTESTPTPDSPNSDTPRPASERGANGAQIIE